MSKIKSFSVGNGDMFYIYHNSDNFTIIDCCYEDEDGFEEDIKEMRSLAAAKGIVRFISTHPDDDHIRGIATLFNRVSIPNFYVVENKASQKDASDSFKRYCELRDDSSAFYLYKNCSRKWMNDSTKERGSSGINILWPNLDNEHFKNALEKVKKWEKPNNICPIFTYSLQDGVKAMWMGDMEGDFLDKVKDDIDWPEVDILFAPHHGRDSGKPSADVLKELNPKLVVIGEADSSHLNYYQGYHTITQNRAKDMLFDCGNKVVDIYVGSDTYQTTENFLKNKHKSSVDGLKYLGTLDL